MADKLRLDMQRWDGQELVVLSKMLISMRTLFVRNGYQFYIKVRKPSSPTPKTLLRKS